MSTNQSLSYFLLLTIYFLLSRDFYYKKKEYLWSLKILIGSFSCFSNLTFHTNLTQCGLLCHNLTTRLYISSKIFHYGMKLNRNLAWLLQRTLLGHWVIIQGKTFSREVLIILYEEGLKFFFSYFTKLWKELLEIWYEF